MGIFSTLFDSLKIGDEYEDENYVDDYEDEVEEMKISRPSRREKKAEKLKLFHQFVKVIILMLPGTTLKPLPHLHSVNGLDLFGKSVKTAVTLTQSVL